MQKATTTALCSTIWCEAVNYHVNLRYELMLCKWLSPGATISFIFFPMIYISVYPSPSPSSPVRIIPCPTLMPNEERLVWGPPQFSSLLQMPMSPGAVRCWDVEQRMGVPLCSPQQKRETTLWSDMRVDRGASFENVTLVYPQCNAIVRFCLVRHGRTQTRTQQSIAGRLIPRQCK